MKLIKMCRRVGFFCLAFSLLSLTAVAFAQNIPPVITTTAPTGATEDIAYIYSASVTDPDVPPQTLTWVVSGRSVRYGSDPDQDVGPLGVSWTPGEGVTSSGIVRLRVADGNGGSA